MTEHSKSNNEQVQFCRALFFTRLNHNVIIVSNFNCYWHAILHTWCYVLLCTLFQIFLSASWHIQNILFNDLSRLMRDILRNNITSARSLDAQLENTAHLVRMICLYKAYYQGVLLAHCFLSTRDQPCLNAAKHLPFCYSMGSPLLYKQHKGHLVSFRTISMIPW